jgi:hypothetical protein
VSKAIPNGNAWPPASSGATATAERPAPCPVPGDAGLEALQRAAFAYFLRNRVPANGLYADTSRPGSPVSIAVVGFALSAYPVAVERGWIARGEALEHCTAALIPLYLGYGALPAIVVALVAGLLAGTFSGFLVARSGSNVAAYSSAARPVGWCPADQVSPVSTSRRYSQLPWSSQVASARQRVIAQSRQWL